MPMGSIIPVGRGKYFSVYRQDSTVKNGCGIFKNGFWNFETILFAKLVYILGWNLFLFLIWITQKASKICKFVNFRKYAPYFFPYSGGPSDRLVEVTGTQSF